MKKKMLLMMLALTVSVALIVGATMSWFTNEAETDNAVFQAGTVKIEAERVIKLEDKGIKNVNPGDCYILEYDITNTGTKQIELRSIFNTAWEDNLSRKNIFIVPHKDSDWVLYQPDDAQGPGKKIYAYYMGGPVDPEESVKLNLVVYFDGALTGNNYQGKEFTVSGDVEAVQASHEAASEVWGDGWDTVTGDGYSFDYEGWYLNELDPEDIDCYDADLDDPEEPEPTPDPEPEMGSLYSYNEDIDVEHEWWFGFCTKTTITLNFTNAKDQYDNDFTGEQQFELKYRTSHQGGPNQYDTKTITVEFENGEAEHIEEFIPGISSVNNGTTTVTKVEEAD
jgi:predicted ribosomally synthesized peptide with SipW-like signal peptide